MSRSRRGFGRTKQDQDKKIVEFLLWFCLIVSAYVYVGYPLLLSMAGSMFPRRATVAPDDYKPAVTLVISAYNEEAVILSKLENSMQLRYPSDKLEVIVVSDCSSDGTDEIVEDFPSKQVKLLRMKERGGKSVGLNEAVRQAAGEVILFTDANAMFDPGALHAMTRHFADPSVGAVTGQQKYFDAEPGDTTDEGLYWRYELRIKELESRVGSLVGGDGAILAIRRDLFVPLDPPDLSDFILPLRVVGAGYRNIYEPQAACYEHSADSTDKEFSRKVRIVNRAWRATLKLGHMLNPLHHGWFALQLISHKLLRWFIGLFMIGALLSNLFVLHQGPIYTYILLAQLAFYLLAAGGMLMEKQGHPAPVWMSAPYYLCLVNFAGLLGVLQNFTGKTYTTWATAREGSGK